MRPSIIFNLLFILIFVFSFPDLEAAPFKKGVQIGTIVNPEIQEISGMVSSEKNNAVLWVVNDSGNLPMLYAILPSGKLLKKFHVQNPGGGVKNTDWEDLAGFLHRGKEFLMIADVGDNRAQRVYSSLWVIKEPDLANPNTRLPLEWEMKFQYADGAKDCESLAIDAANKRILLLSKREKHPTLYELPLIPYPDKQLFIARPIGKITNIPRPTKADLKAKYGKVRSMPTSMDLSLDGRSMVILTYKHAYLYKRTQNQSWRLAFNNPPKLIVLPNPDTGILVQREALCIDHDTGNLIVTSEKKDAPIYVLRPNN